MQVRLRSSSQRAARILFLGAVLFFSGQLAVGVLLDRAPLSVRFPEAAAVLQRARAQNPPPDIVLFGSSRFMAAIAPSEIDQHLRASHAEPLPGVLPMAVLGGDFVSTEFLLDRMLAEGVRPRIALIEVSPDLVGRPPHLLSAQLERLFAWRDVMHWLPELVEADWSALLTARMIPAYHYRRELLGWWVGRPPPFLFAAAPEPWAPAGSAAPVVASASSAPAGQRTPPSNAPDDPTHGVERWARWLRRYRISQRCAAVLERVLARCRSEEITCILVEPPVASGHRALYGREVVTPYRALLDRLGRDYGVTFYDFGDRLPDTSFRDDSHVNHTGAIRFSALLAGAVIEPLWFGGEDRTTTTDSAP